MVKEPRPGRVKTRLGREIGMTTAAWWFRHQSTLLLRRLRDRRWAVTLAVSPDRDGLLSRVWPGDLGRLPQGRGDLGARMSRLLRRKGEGPVLIVGSDIPGIGRGEIARAFHALQGADAVIGPATDGGYWLIGWRGPKALPRSLFRNVRWSTEHALADTRAGLSGFRIAETDILSDVDTAEDLARSRLFT